MSKLEWDQVGKRLYETGVDHGVLYIPLNGVYSSGYAWNGLTAVTEAPSGAEPTPLYADNIKYLNVLSREDFMATVEAFTYPAQFEQCDGSASPQPGVSIAQQSRKTFGLSYRTRVGNDELYADFGYKLHLIYGALAAPSEKSYATINDSPEAITFSWELSTTEVAVTGYKPTSLLTIDSTKVAAAKLTVLENALYGTATVDPRLPLPNEVLGMFSGSNTVTAAPPSPTYNATTKALTIPVVTGVDYRIDNIIVTGTLTITKDTLVTATPQVGYVFPATADDDWFFAF